MSKGLSNYKLPRDIYLNFKNETIKLNNDLEKMGVPIKLPISTTIRIYQNTKIPYDNLTLKKIAEGKIKWKR